VPTYAIGDVQGCDASLGKLLEQIAFDPARDRLWFVGDLVNRGPRSLQVLRRVHALGDRAVVVLGNHDLHLIARDAGLAGPKKRDTLDEVLAAPDRKALCTWLRSRPLMHREGPWVMVHAGLRPEWTVDEAEHRAHTLEALLRGEQFATTVFKGNDDLQVFARLRALFLDGKICDFDGSPADLPKGAVPWFKHPARKNRDATIVFGHWSALGLHLDDQVAGLDTGCVWGRSLTAMRLEDRAIFSQPSLEGSAP
jgi:bis(5'-nucleosyl)-tetraphosphatase (symmetrical)